MNAGLALKEWGGHNGYKVVLSESIANIIQKLLQLIKGHCEHLVLHHCFSYLFTSLYDVQKAFAFSNKVTSV